MAQEGAVRLAVCSLIRAAVNAWTRWPASASAVVYVNSNGNVNTNSPANNNYARPDLWRTRDCGATRMVHHTKEAAYYLCYERQR
nr:MAG TPA: hypothetical protein [Caudoviricetes sp.]